jgi:dihydrodipicolinate synthase/N-acetylneuraminate lyase
MAPDILATCVVPWDARGRFDEERFRAQVRTLAAGLTRHLYVFGTAGEGYAVSDRQFAAIAEAFADEAAGAGATPMLGVISLSLSTVIERIELGLALGFAQFQLSLPSWGALRDGEVARFFAETCDRFPDARFLHYNNRRAGRVLRGAEYRRLADRHENLAAIKFTSSDADVVRELVAGAAPLQCYLTEDAFALAADEHECGLLTSVVHADFALARAFHAARGDRLRELLREAHRIDAALMAAIGDEDVHMDGAYDKLIARLHDPGLPLRLLAPYASATDEHFEALRAALARSRA